VGAVRLARLIDDPAAEQKAWWLLARAAVLRLAMGTLLLGGSGERPQEEVLELHPHRRTHVDLEA